MSSLPLRIFVMDQRQRILAGREIEEARGGEAAGSDRQGPRSGIARAIGKCFGSFVRQTRMLPLTEPQPFDTDIKPRRSTASPPSAATAPPRQHGEARQAPVRPAEAIPETEIEAIIAPVINMVALVVAGGDQPAPGRRRAPDSAETSPSPYDW